MAAALHELHAPKPNAVRIVAGCGVEIQQADSSRSRQQHGNNTVQTQQPVGGNGYEHRDQRSQSTDGGHLLEALQPLQDGHFSTRDGQDSHHGSYQDKAFGGMEVGEREIAQ